MNWNIFQNIKNNIKKYFGVNIVMPENTGKINVDNISTINTCIKILTENVSRLPVQVKDGEGNVIKQHIISKLFNSKINNYLTSDKARKILEKDRVKNGNAFAKINYNHRGELDSLTLISYNALEGIVLKNNNLFYAFNNENNIYSESKKTEIIRGDNILHFTFSNIENFIGISPLNSLIYEQAIRQRASETLINFYKNNAMSPLVLSSSIADLSQVKALNEFTQKFQLDSAGSENAGKIIKLNPGMRLDKLDVKLVDAELINTLKFTNEQIISAFGIPSFLMSYETTQSIENQTLEFKNFTLNTILASYKNEIETKLLTTKEIEEGYSIDFDYSVLLDADLKTKAESYKTLFTNGLIGQKEAIKKLGYTYNEDDIYVIQKQYVLTDSINLNEVNNDKELTIYNNG